MKKNKFLGFVLTVLLILLIQPKSRELLGSVFTQSDFLSQLGITHSPEKKLVLSQESKKQNDDLLDKSFDGNQVIVVNEKAQFTKDELSLNAGNWQKFSALDFLNRVGVANALLGKEMMPEDERQEISSVTPTGFKNKKILINGKEDYLYNRCHLIGYQLTGENANPNNLMTGTRSLNANFEDEKSSMVYYENLVATYIKTTSHHVRYRVTPLFKNVELVARGVRMEAQSIEDNTISFDVYIFNIQAGYDINYLTGYSKTKN